VRSFGRFLERVVTADHPNQENDHPEAYVSDGAGGDRFQHQRSASKSEGVSSVKASGAYRTRR